ncbi:uncharacterized protein [Henckelia pumila]|uniref:uncharacterized protein n=1 Tax=Henckelia pumila TaxID=405737 RepID=UPI003C6E65F8
MDTRRRNIILIIMLHRMLLGNLLMVCVLARHYKNLAAKRRRVTHKREVSYNMTQRIQSQINHLHRITEIGDAQCVLNLRMNRNAFARLCYLLTNIGGLVESRYLKVEEKVAMFLSILAHHKKNRVTGHDYMRSGHTVSKQFHEVLGSILRLHPILLVKPLPIAADCSNETWKWFKGCLGALDGTYVSVNVPKIEQPKFITRKSTIAINVLAVCDHNMNFSYTLCGWEGSAADSRVLRDAITRNDGFKVPRGCYYLCDNGYANVEGFLTPYRRVRYHIDAWGNSAVGPQNYKEFFNYKHYRARNVIERAFGLLKKRWAVLRSPTYYPLKIQNRMIMACILLHNFIRTQMPNEVEEELEEAIVSPTHGTHDDYIDTLASSQAWDMWRDNLATSMYKMDS